MAGADYYDPANHEAASKFLGQKLFRLNIQQRLSSGCIRLAMIRFDERMRLLRVRPMKKILLLILLMASPAWAQTQLTPKASAPKGTAARVVDNCAPIGRTAKGELVYSIKCDNLPAPPAPPPQAEVREAPAAPPEPEVQRGGIFGWSYDRRQ